MTTLDKFLVSVDRRPWDGVLRALIGFFSIPVLSLFGFNVSSGWTLAMGVLALLFSLRVVPVFLRKLLPLSPEVKEVWAERRQVAKRYDSFQWQKLFFTGIGIACYILVSSGMMRSSIVVACSCILFGAFGLLRWHMQLPHVRNSLVHKYVL